MDVIEVLETFGNTVLLNAEITGLTETMIEEFQEAWDRGGKLADVFGQLAEWGIKQDVAERFIKEHDVHTCAVLERNPYAPVESISGYGWKTADTLGITHFGFADDDPRRVQGGLAEAVRLATIADGHTWMTYPDAVIRAGGLLGLDTELIEVVIAESVDTDGLIRAEDRVWPRVLWDAEQTIARGYTQQIEQESLLSQEKIASIERPAGSVLSAEQWDAVMTALSCPISLLTGGPGCLTGDTIIGVNRARKGFKITLKDLVAKFNNPAPYCKNHTWDLAIPTKIQRADGGVVRLVDLVNAWESGVKPVYKITTETGRTIRATAGHPFLTDGGTYARVEDLSIGSLVCVETGHSRKGYHRTRYHSVATRFHPRQRRKGVTGWRTMTHQMVMEAAMNEIPYEMFLHIVRTDQKRARRLRYLSEGMVVHHKDRNPRNNDLENLILLTHEDHVRLHVDDCKNNVLLQIGIEAITAIEPCGEEMTYDLEVASEPHNFLANGFVAHNCGKTTAIRTLIEVAAAQNIGCTLMAPTGKAALRMAEATGVAAKTLHSALGLIPGSSVSRLKEPLSGLVIVDEFSMVDAQMAAALFTSLGRAHLLLVGDPDQLPSVGPGAVLRDILTVATCPRTHLTRMYRNDAGIAINAAHIRAGERIENLPDCLIMSAQTQETATAKVLNLLIDTLPAMGYERSDVLVLCATNDMRIALNTQLQTVFNSQEAGQGYTVRVDKTHSYELRLGDVVMVSKNNSELGVFNGQIGTVQGITGRSVDVELDGTRVSFTGDDRRTVQLAYAITGHKSQGSEAKVVIAPMFQSRVLSKEWLYTVTTRARERAYLIGDPSAMQGCLRKSTSNERRTSLVESMRTYDC